MRKIMEFKEAVKNEVDHLVKHDAEMRQYMGDSPKHINTWSVLDELEQFCSFSESVERNEFHGLCRFTAKASAFQRKNCLIEEFKKFLTEVQASEKNRKEVMKELEIALLML